MVHFAYIYFFILNVELSGSKKVTLIWEYIYMYIYMINLGKINTSNTEPPIQSKACLYVCFP